MSTRNRPLTSWAIGATAALLLTGLGSPAAASVNPEITGCIVGLNCGGTHHHHHRIHRAPPPPNPAPAIEEHQIQPQDLDTPPMPPGP